MGSYQVVLRELKRQKSSKPSRDFSQSVCQTRMKSAYAEATQCSYFNVIQFALTAADTKWVIILHCSFFKQGLCKLFLYSLQPVLHKQRAMKTSEDTRRKEDVSETERRTLLNTAQVYSVRSEGHGSDSLPIFITSRLVLLYTGQHLKPRAWLRV